METTTGRGIFVFGLCLRSLSPASEYGPVMGDEEWRRRWETTTGRGIFVFSLCLRSLSSPSEYGPVMGDEDGR
jgi:hypothetical protein